MLRTQGLFAYYIDGENVNSFISSIDFHRGGTNQAQVSSNIIIICLSPKQRFRIYHAFIRLGYEILQIDRYLQVPSISRTTIMIGCERCFLWPFMSWNQNLELHIIFQKHYNLVNNDYITCCLIHDYKQIKFTRVPFGRRRMNSSQNLKRC